MKLALLALVASFALNAGAQSATINAHLPNGEEKSFTYFASDQGKTVDVKFRDHNCKVYSGEDNGHFRFDIICRLNKQGKNGDAFSTFKMCESPAPAALLIFEPTAKDPKKPDAYRLLLDCKT